MILRAKKLTDDATLPTHAHTGDLGYDLYASADVSIPPMTMGKVPTGIAIELPPFYGGLLRDRSSMAAKGCITMGGVIDWGYRGEIVAMIFAINGIEITKGDKICQLVPMECLNMEVSEVQELSTTPRGYGGFGSTGK